jgi:hypothetical protein
VCCAARRHPNRLWSHAPGDRAPAARAGAGAVSELTAESTQLRRVVPPPNRRMTDEAAAPYRPGGAARLVSSVGVIGSLNHAASRVRAPESVPAGRGCDGCPDAGEILLRCAELWRMPFRVVRHGRFSSASWTSAPRARRRSGRTRPVIPLARRTPGCPPGGARYLNSYATRGPRRPHERFPANLGAAGPACRRWCSLGDRGRGSTPKIPAIAVAGSTPAPVGGRPAIARRRAGPRWPAAALATINRTNLRASPAAGPRHCVGPRRWSASVVPASHRRRRTSARRTRRRLRFPMTRTRRPRRSIEPREDTRGLRDFLRIDHPRRAIGLAQPAPARRHRCERRRPLPAPRHGAGGQETRLSSRQERLSAALADARTPGALPSPPSPPGARCRGAERVVQVRIGAIETTAPSRRRHRPGVTLPQSPQLPRPAILTITRTYAAWEW